MNTLYPAQGQPARHDLSDAHIYGSIDIEHSEKDDLSKKIIERKKEYMSWTAPINIMQGLDYMKIELTLPGITKEDCKVGCSGIFLWVKLNKPVKEKIETFYCTFILPENLLTDQLRASYEVNGKLMILIPKQKLADTDQESLFPFYSPIKARSQN